MELSKTQDGMRYHQNKVQLYYFFALLVLFFSVYAETFISMPAIWLSSDTFAHGFLILPISLFLIWEKRECFFLTEKKSNYLLLGGLILSVFAWLVADSVDVLLGKQFMVVLMLPLLVGIFFGTKTLMVYLFPLLYLLFAVPLGEELVPKLQEITAYITVLGLQLTGIPVYREALYISVPAGDFEVAVACSGVRYLIASLALGTLYAYLTYSKLYKRIIFTVFAIIVPIIANGVRAYGIVMIAQLSDMKYATGVDHLIYGWFFFGIVIFFLFYIGNFWKDETSQKQTSKLTPPTSAQESDLEIVGNRSCTPNSDELNQLETKQNSSTLSNGSIPHTSVPQKAPKANEKLIVLVLSLIVIAMGPISKLMIDGQEVKGIEKIQLPTQIENWTLVGESSTLWKPNFKGSDIEIFQRYSDTNQNIDLFLAYFQKQEQGKELVNTMHTIFDLEKFKLLERNQRELSLNNTAFAIDEYVIARGVKKRLIWSWYYIFGKNLNSPVEIKIQQAIGKITGLSVDGSHIAISISFDEKEQAEEQLKVFLSQAWPLIQQTIAAP